MALIQTSRGLGIPKESDQKAVGISPFLFVDNVSQDGTADHLAAQSDTSVWTTADRCMAARSRLDWVNRLLRRWALVPDDDDLLICPDWQTRTLTDWLEAQGANTPTSMLPELYPKGPLSQARHGLG